MNSCGAVGGRSGIGVGGATGIGGSSTVSAQSALASSLDSIGSNLNQCEEVLQNLFQRLKPIRNEKSLAGSPENNKPPMPMTSSVVASLDGYRNRLQAIRLAIEIVIGELEV